MPGEDFQEDDLTQTAGRRSASPPSSDLADTSSDSAKLCGSASGPFSAVGAWLLIGG